ncbi:MAG: hypothetical protein SVY53_02670 [Chloroflexota bacterium]|nr:hypothetical protein [Chloroflexota bacterium]
MHDKWSGEDEESVDEPYHVPEQVRYGRDSFGANGLIITPYYMKANALDLNEYSAYSENIRRRRNCFQNNL